MSRSRWMARFGFGALGMLLALTQVPFSLIFLMFLVLPLVIWRATLRQGFYSGFGAGWWLGLGYFSICLHWIVEPFLVDADVFGWMAPFALLFMAGGLALFWGVAFGGAMAIGQSTRQRIVILIVLWSISEYLRTLIFTGFPWGLLAYSWVETPLAQLAYVIGPQGLGMLTVGLLAIPVIFSKQFWQASAMVLVVFGTLSLWGHLRIPQTIQPHPDNKQIRLIQPNAPQHLKWRADMIPVFFNRALDYTSAPANHAPDVVIWPESSIPFFLDEDPAGMGAIGERLGGNTALIAGIRRFEAGNVYNAMVYRDKLGRRVDVYDKHHLVPFGEYIPFEKYLGAVGLKGLADNVGGFSAGVGSRVIAKHELPAFLPLICYEAIFPRHSRATMERPDWIVHITNDAWFGTFSGPFQHLAQTKFRAIEQGLPIARAANTGVSGMIDPYGGMAKAIALGRAGFVDVALPAPLKPGIYARFGELPWMSVAMILLIFGWRDRFSS